MSKPVSPSRSLGAKTMFAAMEALRDRGGSLPTQEVIEEVRKRVSFDNWAIHRYEATGAVRWISITC